MSYEIEFLQSEVNSLKSELKEIKEMLAGFVKQKNQTDIFYSIEQVADKLNVSKRTVSRMIDNDELKVVNRNISESGTKKLIRIPASSLAQWAKQNQASIN